MRDHDTVGRLGGDEFVVLVESSADRGRRRRPRRPAGGRAAPPRRARAGRRPVTVTASIGVAVGQYATPDALLRDADLALYAAKAAGRDRYSLFDASMHDDAQGRRALERRPRRRAGGRISSTSSTSRSSTSPARRVEGVEALLRWRHPVRGHRRRPTSSSRSPRRSGLIVPIGRWVLEEACRQAAAWARAGREIGISVNVSAFQLGREDFAEDVRRDAGRDRPAAVARCCSRSPRRP